MNDDILDYLRRTKRTLLVFPGDGFETLTNETACAYSVDDDGHITETVLTTGMWEPLDDVSAFFNQQIFLAANPNEQLASTGVRGVRDPKQTVVRLFLHGVPAWQCAVLEKRITDKFTATFV